MREVLDRLRDADYKLTPQRKLVVETLLEHSGSHLSAEDIYGLIKERHPEIGLATVYRTLELLSELNVLLKLDFGDGRCRYEFSEDTHHHHHLICLKCGRVEEFAEDLLDRLEEEVERRSGFDVTDHQVKFYGRCRECREEADDWTGKRR